MVTIPIILVKVNIISCSALVLHRFSLSNVCNSMRIVFLNTALTTQEPGNTYESNGRHTPSLSFGPSVL